MKSLATYYLGIVESEYIDWKEGGGNDGVPGRLVLREFDPQIVKSILDIINSSQLPLASVGSDTGFIVAVEDHEYYADLDAVKYSFADLTHERNREGNYFCLMFIAETKPTHDQVTRIDQSIVFESTETLKWVEISKNLQINGQAFLNDYVSELVKFISELTHSKWNNRPFIEIDKISIFIDNVIFDTIKYGLFWDAVGKNCCYLGGINRLDEFRSLETAGKNFRKNFRKKISNTLFVDIDFWRAIYKNKEVDKLEIEENLSLIKKDDPEYTVFCNAMSTYFDAYFSNVQEANNLRNQIQLDYDSHAPFSSVLQPKKTKIKFNLGEKTLLFLSDNDIDISDAHREIIERVDDKANKPEKNELRKFYFTYSKDISEDVKLDKAWLKEISTSKLTESNDLIEGLLVVLSKSIFLVDIGEDKIKLRLAKDRTKKSLLKKNQAAMKFIFSEYRDLTEFWALFGDNFELDLPESFSKSALLDSNELKIRPGKAANELYFRVLRYSEDPSSPSETWDLKWKFNPHGFESVKYFDFEKIINRKGFFHKHEISIDPLFIKCSECSPTITNTQMFSAVGTRTKRGAVVKENDKEDNEITDRLSKLLQCSYLTCDEHDNFVTMYNKFFSAWKEAVAKILDRPLCADLTLFEESFKLFIELLLSKSNAGENFRDLLYEFITAHTLFVNDNSEYAVFLPWSPYSLLMTAKKNKLFRNMADAYKHRQLHIGNTDDGVLSTLISELNESYGKGLFLRKDQNSRWNDLVCTQSRFGYFEYASLANSKNAINEKEIRSVVKATTSKFLEIFPNERHHLQVICDGLLSYEHVLAVYGELFRLSEDQEDQISLSLTFMCKDRLLLDVIYQRICESFDVNKIDDSIKIRLISSLNEIDDGEIDLLFSFDPLFTTNVQSHDAPMSVTSDSASSFWEYCASRKVPSSDPISKKSLFSLNNHVIDSTAMLFQKSFMQCSGNNSVASFCREVAQTGLKDSIASGLAKSNWLVIYDYLLCKETLTLSENMSKSLGHGDRRVLRYVQGEGLKRSLAIVTDKETHYITTNLSTNLRKWGFVHPDDIESLVDTIFTLSNSFSSDVLLKSVGNGNFSHDLVGTAGSAILIESIFEDKEKISPMFWVHLDDYIGWFKSSIEDDAFKSIGRSVNYVSDLLGIYLNEENDGLVTLSLIVCESKLINGSVEQSVKSCKQLKSTSELVQTMLNSSQSFDFYYWLNKFLEFVIGNFKFIPNRFDFNKLLSLDKESIHIDLYGLSVLFHYDNDSIQSEFYSIYDCDHLNQVSLSFADTKKVFKNMLDSSNGLTVDIPITPMPLKLNRIKVDAETQYDVSSGGETSNNKQEFPVISEHQEKEHAIVEMDIVESLSESMLSGTERATLKKPAQQFYSASDKSALDLVGRCIDFLEINTERSEKDEIDVDVIKKGIRKIFSHETLPSNFSESIITPNSIVIKLHGDMNLNANKIFNLRGAFLSVVGLSLRQVYPAPGVMALVFDRDKRQTVYFGALIKKTFIERERTLSQGFNNKILIGQNEFSEDCSFFKLDGASPHALIGGQTKSGKSILMNNMILDLMMTNTPDRLKLRLFDPKQVEFSMYSDSLHLAHPVVLDKETAVTRLKELEMLMNDRYIMLKDLGIKDFETYNLRLRDKKMSREVVFFDELADWILDNEFKKEAKDIIVRLSSKGRAAGVHLVIATQRPSNDVVFTLLRANLDTKIALKVDRDLNSEIILGEPGAENLLGYGHGIVKSEGKTMYVQVGFSESHVFDALVRRIIDYWKGA